MGIDERLGERIPLDLVFNDEDGNPVALADVIDGPTVLSLVYYGCPGICPALLNGVVWVVNRAPSTPGQEYRLVTISFDPEDSPEMARAQKERYLAQLKKPVTPEGWRFLTGGQESIDRLTDAVGYRYQRVDGEFLHPTSLMVLSPNGKIARYLYGVSLPAVRSRDGLGGGLRGTHRSHHRARWSAVLQLRPGGSALRGQRDPHRRWLRPWCWL